MVCLLFLIGSTSYALLIDTYTKKIDMEGVKTITVTEFVYENEKWIELDNIWAEYDTNGNVLFEKRETVEGEIQFDYRYAYDQNDQLIKIEGQRLRNCENVDYHYEYRYDTAGNQIEGIRFDEDLHVISCYKAQYDENGNFILGVNYSEGIPTSKYEAEYDLNGNMIVERRYTGYRYKEEDHYQLEYQLEYLYDKAGNVILESRFDGYLEPEYQYHYLYDDAHHLIEALNYDSQGTLVSSYQAFYEGDNLIEFTIVNADGEIQTKHIAEYDNGKMVLEMDNTNPNNLRKIYEAGFDQQENKTYEINYETTIGSETFIEKYEYSYDINNNCIEEVYYLMDEISGEWRPVSKQFNAIEYHSTQSSRE